LTNAAHFGAASAMKAANPAAILAWALSLAKLDLGRGPH
jgi:hypothetical protein